MCALADRMSGPLTPKCVNSISPKSEWIFLLFSYTVSATLRRLSPCSGAQSYASERHERTAQRRDRVAE